MKTKQQEVSSNLPIVCMGCFYFGFFISVGSIIFGFLTLSEYPLFIAFLGLLLMAASHLLIENLHGYETYGRK